DRGMLTCHDARTGREVYGKQRIDPEASAFTASPWAYNGKLFALSEDGDTFVMQAGEGIQSDREKPARRDVHGDPGHRARKSYSPDGNEAVPHRKGAVAPFY